MRWKLRGRVNRVRDLPREGSGVGSGVGFGVGSGDGVGWGVVVGARRGFDGGPTGGRRKRGDFEEGMGGPIWGECGRRQSEKRVVNTVGP